MHRIQALHHGRQYNLKIYQILNRNGLVEITVPNFDGLGRHLFGRGWYAFQPPTHLYHYTPPTITKELVEIGFKDVIIMHNNWNNNFYILFESIRLAFSPKYKGDSVSKFVEKKVIAKENGFSIKMEIGKLMARSVATGLSILEPVIRKGEVMTIYATKN